MEVQEFFLGLVSYNTRKFACSGL